LQGEDVVGFARLQPSAKDPVGATWGMISSVVTQPRQTGIGKELMRAMEYEALAQGYVYACIWTDDDSSVTGFYRKCGYTESEPASTASAVLSSKNLNLGALNKLFQSRTPAHGQKCMRKRLVVKKAPLSQKAEQGSENDIALGELQIAYPSNPGDWKFIVRPITWERQIGPCCGLAAVRMVGRYLKPAWEDESDLLMKRAIEKGFSKDGEIFDIHNLAGLCEDVVGVKCVVRHFEEVTSGTEFCSSVDAFAESENLVILPYDKGSGSGYPELKHGLFAHYCILVGVAENFKTGAVLYLARHGASSKLIAAPREAWIASNSQLLKRDVVRYKDDTDAINLAERCIVVSLVDCGL
jgi:hypothetical protein